MIKPLHDNVMIKPDNPEKISKGGVIIPDVAKDRTATRGVVVEKGDKAGIVNVGDVVILAKFSGSEIEIDRVTYYIVKEEDILAIERG